MKLRFNLANQLLAGYGVIILVAVLASLFCFFSLRSNQEIDERITQVNLPFYINLKEMKSLAGEMNKLTNSWIFQPNPTDKKKLMEVMAESYPALNKKIADLISNPNGEATDSIRLALNRLAKISGEERIVTNLLSADSLYSNDEVVEKAIDLLNKSISPATVHLMATLGRIIDTQEQKIELAQLEKEKSYVLLTTLLVGMIVAFIVTTVAAYSNVKRRIVTPIVAIKDSLVDLSQGKIIETIEQKRDDEVGEMQSAMAGLIKGINAKVNFASQIGSGKYEEQFDLLSEQDGMGKALLTMRHNLKQNAEEERKRNWSVSGLAKLGDILRIQDQNLQKFGEQVLSFIVKYTDSNQGRLYVVNDDVKKQEYLQMIACYAWDKKKFIEQKVERGDGLTGQCWQEGEPIYMTQVPENYVSITSGLGLANPRNIFIVPLKVNEGIFGVLELASFKIFEEYERDFIVKLSENLAAAISTVRINDRTKQLLEQSQQQAEEMKAQEEEMRQNMEELTATQEEMQRKESEMLGHLEAINNSQAFIEFDLDGNIIEANDIFLKTMKYSIGEIKGKHHRMFVEREYAESQEYRAFWQSFKDGKAKAGEFLRKAKDGSNVWILANYTPVINAQGVVIKVIKLARNITKDKLLLEQSLQQTEELKAQEEEIKQNMEELSAIQEDMQRKEIEMVAQLKAIDNSQAFIEFDLEGNIVNANDIFLNTMKYTLGEIKGKHHRIFVEKDYAESPEYRDFWKSFKDGKAKAGEFLRKAKDGSTVWISANYTPVVDPHGRILKIIKLARNITNEKQLLEQSQKQAKAMMAQEERTAKKEKEYLERIKELERQGSHSLAK
jgi:PAS domain S-box-containing protein